MTLEGLCKLYNTCTFCKLKNPHLVPHYKVKLYLIFFCFQAALQSLNFELQLPLCFM